jgi:hypothetical protein
VNLSVHAATVLILRILSWDALAYHSSSARTPIPPSTCSVHAMLLVLVTGLMFGILPSVSYARKPAQFTPEGRFFGQIWAVPQWFSFHAGFILWAIVYSKLNLGNLVAAPALNMASPRRPKAPLILNSPLVGANQRSRTARQFDCYDDKPSSLKTFYALITVPKMLSALDIRLVALT